MARLVGSGATLAVAALAFFSETSRPYELGSRLELFVDDALIERMDGLELRLHSPRPAEVAHECDRPWEGPTTGFVTVLKDGDRYRMYYPSDHDGAEPDPVPMAESRDGVTWTRPELGLVEYGGSRRNNLVLRGDFGATFAPFLDGNPRAPVAERYKAFGRVGDSIYAFVSPDGVRWSRLQPEPVLTRPPFDSQNLAFWDAGLGKYVAYMRGAARPDGTEITQKPRFADSRGDGFRAIRRAVSDDFRRWSEPRLIDFGAPLDEHLYTNAITPYFRAPHVYVGFPMRFEPRRKLVLEHAYPGVSDAVFISSRDGQHWSRRFREAFIRPGLDRRNWTDRNLITAAGVVPIGRDEISIYYVENYRHPTNRIRRGALRVDGFVSVHAAHAGGELVTRPLVFDGSELVLNFSTSAVGSVRVRIEDGAGGPVPGFRLDDVEETFGDDTTRVVRWKGGSLRALAGRPVRLRFALRDADLYSMRFR